MQIAENACDCSLNAKKCKVMRIGRDSRGGATMHLDKCLERLEFEYVAEFVYLSVRVTHKEKDIEARLSKANRSAGAINHLLRQAFVDECKLWNL